MSRPFRDLAGQRFGLLTAISPHRGESRLKWLCRCDCGKEALARDGNLISGNTQSCGCQAAKGERNGNYRHGAARTKEHWAWKHMKDRCYNPRSRNFEHWGGRGISVAPEWRDDFSAFLAHVGPAPSEAHSIDRIDNDRGYEPGNVRWATPTQQSRNTRRQANLCLSELAAKHGLNPQTLKTRLKNGWSLDDALNRPVRQGNFHGPTRRA